MQDDALPCVRAEEGEVKGKKEREKIKKWRRRKEGEGASRETWRCSEEKETSA